MRPTNAVPAYEPQKCFQAFNPRFLGGGVSDQVEIIFFSTPTPAATARSYSSGTVAE
jgi:hypothetical protein